MPRTDLTPRKSPSQQRSGVTVDAIVEGAIRILVSDGYSSLTTIRVAKRAGVSVGSLYQYFSNKEAIVAEVVRRRSVEIASTIAAVPGGPTVKASVEQLITALLVEKRRGFALSCALEPALAEVDGRRMILEAARGVIPALAAKLSSGLGRPLSQEELSRLAVAIAAIDGAIWSAISGAPALIDSPAFKKQLEAILLTSIG